MSANRPIGIGIIGAGRRGIRCLASRIVDTVEETDFRIVALCDRRPERLSESESYLINQFANKGITAKISRYDDYQALIDDPAVDLVMITTPQNFHRAPAIAALQSGKKVYCDKPIAHTMADARAIMAAEAETHNPMVMGFTRRYENAWRKAFQLVQDGVVGNLHMLQIRAIIPYNVYFHTWHRRREWSGGALNDKSSHHMDVFNWFAQSQAQHISAFGGTRVFLPQDDAPTRCLECDRDCPYRVYPSQYDPAQQDEIAAIGESWKTAETVFERFDNCVYLPGADIKDHATVQIQYKNGVLASLFLSFFGPKAPDQETFEIVGDKGRIILTRQTGTLDVVSDYGNQHETIDCRDAESSSSHFGADLKLIREIRAFYDGAAPVVSAQNGYEATKMIMAVHDSIDSDGVLVRVD